MFISYNFRLIYKLLWGCKMDNHEMNQITKPLNGQEDLISDSRRIDLNGSNGNEPSGIGGWLILVAINVLLTPILLLRALYINITFISNGALEKLSTPNSQVYSALWKPAALFEIASNILTLLLSIALIYLFFSKKKIFPKFFIGMLLFKILVTIIDETFIFNLSKSTSIGINSNPSSTIIQPIISLVIWGGYMLNSVRVKNTFTR